MTDKLLKLILSNPGNNKVFEFLGINEANGSGAFFKPWTKSRNGFDEGGIIFFDKQGERIPEDCKYCLEVHHIMVNKSTGEIFAFHTGRYSIFFKCDFEKSGLVNSDDFRRGYTFDCITDITALGENWCFIDKFEEEEKEQLEWSFELTKNQPWCSKQ